MKDTVKTSEKGVASLWARATMKEKAVLVIALIYILSPIDLLPELILGPLGLADDGAAIVIIGKLLYDLYQRKDLHDGH